MFPGALQHSTIGQLSGGEKRRLYLLGILMGNVNVLLLDEPTNDLDIQTLQILEDFIDHFAGPVLTVSHDRYFLDRTCEKIFAFEGSGVVDIHTGNYSDYAERRQTMAPADKTPAAEKPAKETTHRPPREVKVKFSYKEAREYETIEADIDALEQAIARAESDMAANSSDFVRLNELMTEKERLEEELLEKMERVGVSLPDSRTDAPVGSERRELRNSRRPERGLWGFTSGWQAQFLVGRAIFSAPP